MLTTRRSLSLAQMEPAVDGEDKEGDAALQDMMRAETSAAAAFLYCRRMLMLQLVLS